jgi:hypothetical protein
MSSQQWPLVLSLAATILAARAARAETGEDVVVDEPQPVGAGHATSAGAFLPLTIGASSDATYGRATSGYDGARRAFVYDAAADAHVAGGLSVRAGYASYDLSGHASALLGGRFQFLSQKRHGLDMSVGLFYLPQDIEGEGLVKASLLFGRNFGPLALFSSVSYGQDPEGDDHHAELAMASLVPLAPSVFVGIDARGRALVFSSDAKHNGISEPVLDIALGPLAHYILGPVVLTSQIGMSALAIEGPHGSTRPTIDMHYGMLGLLSAGLSL